MKNFWNNQQQERPKNKGLWLTILMAAFFCASAFPSPTSAYEHNIAQWSEEQFPLPLKLASHGTRHMSAEELNAAVQASAATWNDVACSSLTTEVTTDLTAEVAIDQEQVLKWIDDADVWVYGSASAGATMIDVLGDNGPRVDIAFNDIYFDWIPDASTFVTPEYDYDSDGALEIDPQSVITHEMGHLLGLAHPYPDVEGSQPDPLATMVFALLPGAQQKTLAGDDKLGLCAKYPVVQSECDDTTPCPATYTCTSFSDDFGSVQLCEENRDSFGDPCGRTRYNCDNLCVFTATDYSTGFCSQICEDQSQCDALEDPAECQFFPSFDGGEVGVCVPGEAPADPPPQEDPPPVEEEEGSDDDQGSSSQEDQNAADEQQDATTTDSEAGDSSEQQEAEESLDTEPMQSSGGFCATRSQGEKALPLHMLLVLMFLLVLRKSP